MDLLAFQAEFLNSGSVTGRQYILVSLEKKIRIMQYKLKEE